jgi:DNA polymerase-1
VNNKSRGYVKGEVFTKVQVIEFNPNSRKHIHYCLVKKYGWKPKSFTPSGEAKVDETVLSQLPYPESKKLAKFMLVQKRIAQLAEGRQAWLKMVDTDGKLRHTIVSGGTVSGRASHRNPNVAQTVSARAAYGKPMRELFTVPKGWHLCGGDLSQLELRCLAYFLDDGGEYAKQIMEGDIHTFNQKAAGLPTRDAAKTFIYATTYGGGDALIGKLVGGSAKDGKRLKSEFDKNIPSFKSLKNELNQAYKRGYLKGLDGRKLFVRSEHKCLSQLLQSAGALLCKKWLALVDQEITRQGLQNDALILAWVHDELQIACRTEEVAHNVGDILRGMAKEAGTYFGITTKLPIEADYAVGRTWCDTH